MFKYSFEYYFILDIKDYPNSWMNPYGQALLILISPFYNELPSKLFSLQFQPIIIFSSAYLKGSCFFPLANAKAKVRGPTLPINIIMAMNTLPTVLSSGV